MPPTFTKSTLTLFSHPSVRKPATEGETPSLCLARFLNWWIATFSTNIFETAVFASRFNLDQIASHIRVAKHSLMQNTTSAEDALGVGPLDSDHGDGAMGTNIDWRKTTERVAQNWATGVGSESVYWTGSLSRHVFVYSLACHHRWNKGCCQQRKESRRTKPFFRLFSPRMEQRILFCPICSETSRLGYVAIVPKLPRATGVGKSAHGAFFHGRVRGGHQVFHRWNGILLMFDTAVSRQHS